MNGRRNEVGCQCDDDYGKACLCLRLVSGCVCLHVDELHLVFMRLVEFVFIMSQVLFEVFVVFVPVNHPPSNIKGLISF